MSQEGFVLNHPIPPIALREIERVVGVPQHISFSEIRKKPMLTVTWPTCENAKAS